MMQLAQPVLFAAQIRRHQEGAGPEQGGRGGQGGRRGEHHSVCRLYHSYSRPAGLPTGQCSDNFRWHS